MILQQKLTLGTQAVNKLLIAASDGIGIILPFFPLSLTLLWLDSPIWAWASSFRRGFMITQI
jgi:hypothetical protein